MDNIIYYSALYDYYESLLTNIQKEYFEEYYFNNLSIQEIADNFKVSKNAISKTIIEVTNKLDYYENNLNLYKNKEEIKKILLNDNNIYKKLEKFI